MELRVPSIRQSLMVYAARWCFSMNPELMNESEDPESTRDISRVTGVGNGLGHDWDNEGIRSGNGGVEGDDSLCTN